MKATASNPKRKPPVKATVRLSNLLDELLLANCDLASGDSHLANYMSVTEIPNFEKLTDLERVELAEELMASLRHPEALPAPLAHQIEVDRRWAEYERNPERGVSEAEFWGEVRSSKP